MIPAIPTSKAYCHFFLFLTLHMASSSSSKTAETNEVSRVLITGVSGYIGAHVARACLDAGFRVRGTTRSLKNAEKVEALRNIAPGAAHSIELVEIDLLDANAWTEAVKGCSHILHVASPLDRHMKEAEIVNVAVTVSALLPLALPSL